MQHVRGLIRSGSVLTPLVFSSQQSRASSSRSSYGGSSTADSYSNGSSDDELDDSDMRSVHKLHRELVQQRDELAKERASIKDILKAEIQAIRAAEERKREEEHLQREQAEIRNREIQEQAKIMFQKRDENRKAEEAYEKQQQEIAELKRQKAILEEADKQRVERELEFLRNENERFRRQQDRFSGFVFKLQATIIYYADDLILLYVVTQCITGPRIMNTTTETSTTHKAITTTYALAIYHRRGNRNLPPPSYKRLPR